MTFQDRRDAGRQLAEELAQHDLDDAIVFGMARGGVPVAYEVASRLDAPLDVLVVGKVGAPGNPEYALGAVAEHGVTVLDEAIVERFGGRRLDDTVEQERQELTRRVERYRGGRPPTSAKGRTAVIVDDGIATGRSAVAAVRAARELEADRIVFAAPVGAPSSVEHLREEADEVVCLSAPQNFFAVGAYYRSFGQTSDDEVIGLLDDARDRSAGTGLTGQSDTAATTTNPTSDREAIERHDVEVTTDGVGLPGYLWVPRNAQGLVVFAHGSGSSRDSPRNQQVADHLNTAGFATLLFDLLTEQEGRDRHNVFDIGLLSPRLAAAARWAGERADVGDLPVGLFGASTGAAAALDAAVELGGTVRAVVSRGGRPDLSQRLDDVDVPVLLIVGGRDPQVLRLNRQAAARLDAVHEVEVIEGATHLFEEPGTLDAAADAAARWFGTHL